MLARLWPAAMGAARSRPGYAPALCARLRFARLLAYPQHYCGVSRSVLAVDHSVSKQICRDPDTRGRLVCHAADLISQCRGTPLSGGPRVRTRSTSISLDQSLYDRSTYARWYHDRKRHRFLIWQECRLPDPCLWWGSQSCSFSAARQVALWNL